MRRIVLLVIIGAATCHSRVFAQTQADKPGAAEDWRYVAAAFVGSKFGDSASEASIDLGGSLTWRFRPSLGVEVLGAYAPSVEVFTPELEGSRVNDLMFNAVSGIPILSSDWHVFGTGGFGLIHLSSEGLAPDSSNLDPDGLNDSYNLFGFNIGVGVVRFLGNWGVRAVVRYSAVVGNGHEGSEAFLNDIGYWRGNVGVAYRW